MILLAGNLVNLMTLVECAIVLMLVVSMVFDLAAQFVRGNVSAQENSELIAVGNWIQYQARILTMISIVTLSFMFERNEMEMSIELLFFVALLFSSAIGLAYIKSKRIFMLTNFLLLSPNRLLFKRLVVSDYFIRLKFRMGGAFFYSLIYQSLLYAAIFAPFAAASIRPDLRMTLAYAGQSLNFLGSVVHFTAVEPRYFRAIDAKDEGEIASQLIFAKLFSASVMMVILGIFSLVRSYL